MWADTPQRRVEAYAWLCHGMGLCVLVAGGLLSYFLIHVPLRAAVVGTETDISALEMLLEQSPAITAKAQQLKTKLAELERMNTDLLERIPAGPRESDFLAQVSEVANRSGLQISGFHPGSVFPFKEYQEVEVRLNAQGNYAAVCDFLDHLDQIPRLNRLLQFEITAPPAVELLPFEMRLRLLYMTAAKPEDSRKG